MLCNFNHPLFGRELSQIPVFPTHRLTFPSVFDSLARFEPMFDVPRFSEMEKFGKSLSITDDKFEVKLDVANFKPEEVSVKVVGNSLIVEAKHQEGDEEGFFSRHFVRRFALPKGVVLNEMNCKMVENTIAISAPRVLEKQIGQGTSIPIDFTGQETEVPDANTSSVEDAKA